MTRRDELEALAVKCETEGPSRALDGEIMFALYAKPVGDRGFLWPEDDPSWSFAIRFPGKTRESNATLALAICAASLRARAAMETTDG